MGIKLSLAIAVAALTGSIVTASAADIPVKAPPVSAPAAIDWTGWHVGVGVGGSRSDAFWDFFAAPLVGGVRQSVDHSWDQARVSLHSGYQHMFRGFGQGGIVVGVDFATSFPIGEERGSTNCPNSVVVCETSLRWLSTAGGRLGLAWESFLIYGTGGYALGRIRTNVIQASGASSFDDAQRHSGWYYGGGIDWMVWRRTGLDVILGVEYQHVELDAERHYLPLNVVVPLATRDVTLEHDTIRAKLTFKYGGFRWQ